MFHSKNFKKMKKYILTLLTASVFFTSCSRDESLLDKEPQGNVSADQIQDMIKEFPERSLSVLAGAEAGNTNYMIQSNTNGLAAHDDFGYMSIRTGLDHMTNDLVMNASHWFNSYYQYLARNVDNSRDRMVWRYNYKVIYNMNEVLKLIPADVADNDSKYIKGRALAIRANAYMDLVRLYAVGEQGIPYYSLGDNKVYTQSRVPTSQVWGYIEADLLKSFDLLQGYTRASKESVNRNVVAGFLARLYLTTGNYAKAAQFANAARQGYTPMSSTQLYDGFQNISNPEWMWGSDINGSTTTYYASFFSHMSNLNPGYAGLLRIYRNIDSRLYNKISNTDLRKEWFLSATTGALPKYANVKFYDDTFFEGDYLYMRASEFYLIEAEALARSGNEPQARQVLFDLVSKRDPSYVLSTNTGANLLDEIRTHKKIELWGEGNEFFDMKRLNEPLVRNYTGTNHPSFGRLNIPSGDPRFNFQIPQAELDANPDVSNP